MGLSRRVTHIVTIILLSSLILQAVILSCSCGVVVAPVVAVRTAMHAGHTGLGKMLRLFS